MSNTFTISQTPNSSNLYLYPDGTSSTQCIAYPAQASNLCIDETWDIPNNDTDYVYTQAVTSQYDFYTVADHTAESGTINYVKVVCRAKSHNYNQASSGTYKIWLGEGAAKINSGKNTCPLSTTYTDYSHNFTSTGSSQSWTWSAVDNMIIGFECSSPTKSGEIQNLTLYPNGAGNTTDLTPKGDTNNYECVDEVTPNDSVDYVDHSVVSTIKYDTYAIPDHTTETGVINYVDVFVRGAKLLDQDTVQIREVIYLGGTDYNANWNTLTIDWTSFSNRWSSSPTDNSTAFTWIDIDNMEIGVSLNKSGSNSDPRCTQCYAVVNYIEDINPEIRTTQCYAVVNYIPPETTLTLTQPDSISYGQSRDVQVKNYPSGNYAVLDYGRSGKQLSMSGVEYDTTVSRMNSVKNMLYYNAEVTLAGLGNPQLNRNYRILSFNCVDEGGHSSPVYRWNMELEEV